MGNITPHQQKKWNLNPPTPVAEPTIIVPEPEETLTSEPVSEVNKVEVDAQPLYKSSPFKKKKSIED